MAKDNRYAAYSHNSKDLKYDLASQQRNSLEPDQWLSRFSSIRTVPSYNAPPSSSNFTPSPNQIGTPFSTKQERMIITNQSEITIRSPETTATIGGRSRRRRTSRYQRFQLPGTDG